jgi:adenylate cyclase, class 2
MENQEIEVKFFVQDLAALELRLLSIGARLVQPRTLEKNLRFDTSTAELARSFRVLRLRQDADSRLTYKGPSFSQEGVRIRQEIEFSVSDFNRAQQFLEALGYQVTMVYEKYRTGYDLSGTHILLDEMPYGNFVEIEGPDALTIQSINLDLGLNWEAGIPVSYTNIFEQLKQTLGLNFRDLTFENFRGLVLTPADLGVIPAD